MHSVGKFAGIVFRYLGSTANVYVIVVNWGNVQCLVMSEGIGI